MAVELQSCSYMGTGERICMHNVTAVTVQQKGEGKSKEDPPLL